LCFLLSKMTFMIYFAKIAEHKCVEDPQYEMFKYGPFLNLQ
jgi:hypothetical protein